MPVLAWFWVRFPEHFMFIYTTLLAQLHASYGEAYDVTYHGRHTNDSSFSYIEDEMYHKPQGLLLYHAGIDRILL
jgi:hypothetical protein